MKTYVVFNIPDVGLRYCLLTELAMAPQRGSRYILDRKVYEMEQPIEVLGRRPDGTRKGSSQVLLELLAALDGGNPVVMLQNLAHMVNIGEPADATDKSAGGVILSMPASAFDENAVVLAVNARFLKNLPDHVLDLDPALVTQVMAGSHAAAAAIEGTDGKTGS